MTTDKKIGKESEAMASGSFSFRKKQEEKFFEKAGNFFETRSSKANVKRGKRTQKNQNIRI